MFPVDDIYIEILDCKTLSTRFSLTVASDQDVGQNYCIAKSYHISANNHFRCELTRMSRYADPVLVKELDREMEDSCLCGHGNGRWKYTKVWHTTVQVKVIDFNDNRPTFLDSFTRVELYEDAEVELLLSQLSATDPDEGKNGEIMNRLVEKAPAENRQQQIFTIDSCVFLAAGWFREKMVLWIQNMNS